MNSPNSLEFLCVLISYANFDLFPSPTSFSSSVQLFVGLQTFSLSLANAVCEAVFGIIFISALRPFFSLTFSFVLFCTASNSSVKLQLQFADVFFDLN